MYFRISDSMYDWLVGVGCRVDESQAVTILPVDCQENIAQWLTYNQAFPDSNFTQPLPFEHLLATAGSTDDTVKESTSVPPSESNESTENLPSKPATNPDIGASRTQCDELELIGEQVANSQCFEDKDLTVLLKCCKLIFDAMVSERSSSKDEQDNVGTTLYLRLQKRWMKLLRQHLDLNDLTAVAVWKHRMRIYDAVAPLSMEYIGRTITTLSIDLMDYFLQCAIEGLCYRVLIRHSRSGSDDTLNYPPSNLMAYFVEKRVRLLLSYGARANHRRFKVLRDLLQRPCNYGIVILCWQSMRHHHQQEFQRTTHLQLLPTQLLHPTQIPTLMQCSRSAILESLPGRRGRHYVHQLPLPVMLKQYVLFEAQV